MGFYQLLQKLGVNPAIWQIQCGDYQGLAMRCAPGTHEAAMDLLLRHQRQPTSAIELAAGSGAMLARLGNHGYTDLHAVELDHAKFDVPGLTPISLDLNKEFSAQVGRRFGLVVAIEIIEHLDCPRHFLSQIREILDADGLLLLTTPNVADWAGRLAFLLTGELRYFDDDQYQWNHHISPIPQTQLSHIFREIGFELVDSISAGSFFGPLKKLVTAPIWLTFRGLCGPSALGDVNLYIARKTAAQPSRANDWTS